MANYAAELNPEGPIPKSRVELAGAPSSRMRVLRHPLRALCMGLAALAVTFGLVRPSVVALAVLAAVLGVAAGEVLGRLRWRLWVVLLGLAAGLGLALAAAWLVTGLEAIPDALGAATALSMGVVLRLGALALFPVAALRAVACRRPALAVLELVAVVVALALMLSAHRDGIIVRPLWLSDWAWRAGLDPKQVLLGIGAVAVLLLTALMIAETGRRLTALSVLALPLLALASLGLFDVANLPQPTPDSELGLTQANEPGGPPKHMNKGQPDPHGHGGHNQQQKQQGGKQGGKQGQKGSKQGTGDHNLPTEPTQGQGTQPKPDNQGQGQGAQPKDGQKDQQGQGGQSAMPKFSLERGQSDKGKRTPMAVVLLNDDYTPPAQQYYFRMESWSHYNGSRMVAAVDRSDVDRDVPDAFPTGQEEIEDAPGKTGRTLVHADAVLVADHRRPFYLESPVRSRPIPNPNPDRFVRAYRFESLAQKWDYRRLVGRVAGNKKWSEQVLAHYLKGPKDPRYAALAQQIVSKLPQAKRQDPFLAALAVKVYFDRHFIYSTKHRHAGVADPTADFLFGNRTGYCTHFAHAAVYLWRSLNIPARVSVGYAVKADDRGGGTLIITGSDAHAWPELYLRGLGWVLLDISPARNLDPPGTPADQDMLRKLGELARQQPPDPMEPLSTGSQREPGQRAGMVAWSVLALALALLVTLYCIKLWRRLAPRFASRATLPRVGYRMALDVLAEAGLQRDYGETRAGFARRLKHRLPSLEGLTQMNVAARFAPPAAPLDQRPEFSDQHWRDGLRGLRGEVPLASKRWRRLLGLLNPLSFFQSR